MSGLPQGIRNLRVKLNVTGVFSFTNLSESLVRAVHLPCCGGWAVFDAETRIVSDWFPSRPNQHGYDPAHHATLSRGNALVDDGSFSPFELDLVA